LDGIRSGGGKSAYLQEDSEDSDSWRQKPIWFEGLGKFLRYPNGGRRFTRIARVRDEYGRWKELRAGKRTEIVIGFTAVGAESPKMRGEEEENEALA